MSKQEKTMSVNSKIRLVNMENSNLRGFADVTIDDNLTIRNVKIVEGKNGLFASMPSVKGRNDYYEPLVTMEKDYYQKFSDLVRDQAADEQLHDDMNESVADDLPFEQTM